MFFHVVFGCVVLKRLSMDLLMNLWAEFSCFLYVLMVYVGFVFRVICGFYDVNVVVVF